MNWAQLVNTLIFGLEVFAGVFGAIHLANIQKQRLPESLAIRLEQFAHMAVWRVEQQNSTLSNLAKKQLAIADVSKLFKAYKLTVPNDEAMDIAIESAVFLLPKDNSPAS